VVWLVIAAHTARVKNDVAEFETRHQWSNIARSNGHADILGLVVVDDGIGDAGKDRRGENRDLYGLWSPQALRIWNILSVTITTFQQDGDS
jgi:hypothetical protein